MNESTLIAKEFFGDGRLISVEYRLPTNDFDAIEIIAVKINKQIFWNNKGDLEISYNTVDVMPVLKDWQISEIEDDLKDELCRQAEQERLAA